MLVDRDLAVFSYRTSSVWKFKGYRRANFFVLFCPPHPHFKGTALVLLIMCCAIVCDTINFLHICVGLVVKPVICGCLGNNAEVPQGCRKAPEQFYT